VAVEQQHPAAVKALLDGGADVSARTGGSGLPRAYMANAVNTLLRKLYGAAELRGRRRPVPAQQKLRLAASRSSTAAIVVVAATLAAPERSADRRCCCA